MVFFHRKKIGEKSNKDSEKEKKLQGQLKYLQEEMKSINNRLKALQENGQNKCTASPTTESYSKSLLSEKRSTLTRRLIDGPAILHEDLPKNLSYTKEAIDVFVPNEIEFNSVKFFSGEKMLYQENRTGNIFQNEAPSPVQEIVALNLEEADIFPKKSPKEIKYISSSTNKIAALQHCTKICQSSLKNFGDTESTASSQRSIDISENGCKVKRIFRKVRAVRATELANAIDVSRTFMPREINTALSSLSPNSNKYQFGLSEKQRENCNQPEGMASDIFIDIAKDYPLNLKLPTRDRTKDKDHIQKSSRQTKLILLRQNKKVGHANHSMLLDKPEELEITVAEKRTKEQVELFDKNVRTQMLVNFDHIDQVGTELELLQHNRGAMNESNRQGVLSSKCTVVDCLNHQRVFEKSSKYRTEQRNNILVDAQTNTESNETRTPEAKRLDGLSSSNVGDGITSTQVKVSNKVSRGDFLADIRSGIKLKNSEKPVKTEVGQKLDSRIFFQEEPNRSHIEIPIIANSFVESENVKYQLMESQNPASALLEGIKAGVKLKKVNRSSSQFPKKRESQMSTLLAKLQERKEQCLRQELLSVKNSGQVEIDW